MLSPTSRCLRFRFGPEVLQVHLSYPCMRHCGRRHHRGDSWVQMSMFHAQDVNSPPRSSSMLLTQHPHQLGLNALNAQEGHAQQSCYSMLQSVLHSSRHHRSPELTTIVELDTACSHQKLPCARQCKGFVQHGMQTQHVHMLYDIQSERCMVQTVTPQKMIVILYLDHMLLISNQSAC